MSPAPTPPFGGHPGALDAPAPWAERPGTPALDSAWLLQGQREILIQHQGQVYRLQATRQGKLILTK
ncbi:hemin uptake protein HemP [Macromonas nakdongensis]|jgi:hemin uptake protein HemP|uniref:hemin uptake protein HemP n=1 Tax=Macromonas nakdongensis TaxID=1843082 RepID=UPI000C349FB6|nr:hemin uptake protein HemP [Macromonas nakdongensis]